MKKLIEKYIKAFILSILISVLTLEIGIPDFLCGWYGCMGWIFTLKFAELNSSEKTRV